MKYLTLKLLKDLRSTTLVVRSQDCPRVVQAQDLEKSQILTLKSPTPTGNKNASERSGSKVNVRLVSFTWRRGSQQNVMLVEHQKDAKISSNMTYEVM